MEYCPTEDMIADLLTKPVQGAQFRKLRRVMMNLPVDTLTSNSIDTLEANSKASQECAGARSYADVVRGTNGIGIDDASESGKDLANKSKQQK